MSTMSNFRRRMFDLYHDRPKRNVDMTPLPDPLRAETLSGPYYGVQPLESLPISKMLDPKMRAELQERARKREEELRGLYAVLNAGCPINRLPVEILVEIFFHVQEADRLPKWLHLLSVCRYWFVVASTAPKLWKNLRVQGTTNLLRTGLRRSKQAEINVEISPLYGVSLSDALDILAPHVHRVRSLTLRASSPESTTAVGQFLESHTFPALRRFEGHLDRNNVEQTDLGVTFPVERFPKLEGLEVSRMHIFSSTPAFAQLRKIRVNTCVGKNPELTTRMLVDAMCQLRNVEEIELFDTHACDVGIAVVPPREEKVVLSKLRRLTLVMDAPVVKAIISNLVVPATTSISLAAPLMAETPEGDADSLQDLLPDDRSGFPILSQVVTAHVVSLPDRHSINGKTALTPGSAHASSTIQLSLDQYTMGMIDDAAWEAIGLDDFKDILRSAPLQNLTIECTFDCWVDANWPAVFSQYPKLAQLKITVHADNDGNTPSLDIFFGALDPVARVNAFRVLAGSSAEDKVVCPALESIVLSGLSAPNSRAVQTIVDCLENRRMALGKAAGPVLNTLSLESTGHQDVEHYDERRAVFESALSPFVANVVYKANDII
ncbi:hypothetical protein OH77DRAFT_1481963 [Trametes cingulata]|nr:hypothetical protein OH77DRAFT_1481963 [Trametes cingulata]